MRSIVRLAIGASSLVLFVIACSSADSSGSVPNDPDGGNGKPDSSSNPGDSATSEASGDSATNPDSSTADAATDADAATAFTLTSTALAEGASFRAENTCTGGINTSPPLAWSAGPASTMSYAVVFTDLSNALIHSVIYDIPSNVMALPAAVQNAYAPATPAGAHQTKHFGGAFGYAGPCPPEEHTYQFVLYALDVAVLPGADMNTTRAAAETLIKGHSLGTAKLTGKYKQP